MCITKIIVQTIRLLRVKPIMMVLFIILSFYRCQTPVNQIHLEGFAQGTYYSIRYYDPKNRNLQKEIDSLLSEFNKTASIYDETSIVSRINRNEDNVLLNNDFIQGCCLTNFPSSNAILL